MISTAEAAKRHGVNVRRIQKLIKEGRIPGVKMISHVWLLPDNFTISPPPKLRHPPMKIITTAK